MAQAENKHRRGRPSLYKPEYAELAYKFCLLGATDEKMAELFGVNVDTIYEWKKVHPAFSESLKRGKEIADAEVAQSLYKRARGYQYEEVTKEPGEEGEEVTKRVTKEVAPDTGAAMAWLKNRQPHAWRDRQEIDIGNRDDKPFRVDISHLSATELAQLESILAKTDNGEKTS